MGSTVWDSTPAEVLSATGSSAAGLSTADVSDPARRAAAAMGQGSSHRSTWRLLARQFASPIILILLAATVISMMVDDPVDGAIILTIILASGLLGFVQERRADAVMLALLRRVRIHADVLRDGHPDEVTVEDVVRGDVVLLRAGDVVPADLFLLQSTNLLVDESSVTGESAAVEKGGGATGTLPGNAVFYGTHVVSGEGRGVAVAVGRDTRFGALVGRLESADVTTRFEKEMTRFGLMLARVMLLLVAAIVVIDAALQRPFVESLLFALALAVGITPQLLPAIVVVSLSIGARQLAQESVLVKRLDAIEDVGGMTMLCSDKTGTLTAGSVRLDQALDVAGEASDDVLRLGAVNASLQRGYPNGMDLAIRAASPDIGDVLAVDEIPYDFQRRRLSVLADVDGQRLLIVKGAVASVLPACTSVDNREESMAGVAGQAQELFERLSAEGFRVLAVATRPMPGREHATLTDEVDLTLRGFLAFQDPPTADAADAIARLQDLGVEVCLVTGDNEHVARAVASAVGLDTTGHLTGERIEQLAAAELADAARTTRVFAQVDPLQKERIVRALRDAGQTVGFLGDGINDAAALRSADVGISVDNAADVSKHAASLVIMTKDLHVVADAVTLGRRTFANTLKYIRVTVSANFGNVLSMVVAAIFLPFLPMLPVQILLLNLLSDVPAITIATDRVDADQVRTPRVWQSRDIARFMVVFGLVSSVFDISVFLILRLGFDAGASQFHTTWFVLSLLTELVALLVLRTSRPAWRSHPARSLLVASGLVAAGGLGLPFLPFAGYLGLIPLPLTLVVLVLGLCAAYAIANEATKRIWQARWQWQ